MTECPYKDRCPYLGDASREEIFAEKKRLERWLADKDKLITLATEEIRKRDERIKELESQIENFKDALKKAHQDSFKEGKNKKAKRNSEEKAPEGPKKRGAPKGHPGATRAKPKHIDEYNDVYAERCGRCSSENIKHSDENFDEHIVEDIEIVVVTKTTCHRHHKYYCYDCQYTGSSGPAEDEMPGSFIGPVAKSVAAHLRYQIGMTYGQVERVMADLFGLKLTRSALVGFDKAISKKGKPFYEMLKERIYLSPYCCVDETGWLILDIGAGWLWVFTNDVICLYLISKSRGSDVVKLVLGEDYLGILSSDCFSSYNPVSAAEKQKCVVHILRKNKEIQESPLIDTGVEVFTTQVRDLFQTALELKKNWKSGDVAEEELSEKATAFKKELEEITRQELENGDAENLRKRLIKHKDELFVFLTHPYVPADNNLAERSLRPCVIHRKLMYFNTTEQGARHYELIMSLTQTAKRNGQSSLELMKKLLTGGSPEEIIKLLLGDHSKENYFKKEEAPLAEYTTSPEMVPESGGVLASAGHS